MQSGGGFLVMMIVRAKLGEWYRSSLAKMLAEFVIPLT